VFNKNKFDRTVACPTRSVEMTGRLPKNVS